MAPKTNTTGSSAGCLFTHSLTGTTSAVQLMPAAEVSGAQHESQERTYYFSTNGKMRLNRVANNFEQLVGSVSGPDAELVQKLH